MTICRVLIVLLKKKRNKYERKIRKLFTEEVDGSINTSFDPSL